MAVAFVKITPSQGSPSGGSSISSSAFGGAVSSSNIIVCAAEYLRTAGAVTTTFQRSGDPSRVADFSFYNGATQRGMAIGFLTGIGANTNAVTASFSSSVDADRCVVGAEYSGADLVLAIGSGEGAGQTFSSGPSVSTGNGSPTVQPGRRVGIIANFSAATHTPGAGFTSRGTFWDLTFGVGDLGQWIDATYSSTGSQAGADWTVGAGDFGICIMAFVREASAAVAPRGLMLTGVG